MIVDKNKGGPAHNVSQTIVWKDLESLCGEPGKITRHHWQSTGKKHGLDKLGVIQGQLSEHQCYWRKPLIPLYQVRRILNGASDATVIQMMVDGDMPHPIRMQPFPLWDTAEFYCWHWSSQELYRQSLKEVHTATKPYVDGPKDYRQILTRQIHSEAAAHGCALSHTITIGFHRKGTAAWQPEQIRAFNNANREHVKRISSSLGRACWRLWNRRCGIPDDLFLYHITPERLDRFGNEVPWHFHIDLFLRPVEARLLNRWCPLIEQRILRMVSQLPSEPVIELIPVTNGFAGYSQKNIHDTVDMVACNFLHSGHK